jgi:hypothetical protein
MLLESVSSGDGTLDSTLAAIHDRVRLIPEAADSTVLYPSWPYLQLWFKTLINSLVLVITFVVQHVH